MAGNNFTPVPNLNGIVARMVAPEVWRIAKRVEIEAKKLAPGVKRWVSMSDALVRDTHREAHGQELPENLRFEVRAQPWDIEHLGRGPIEYLLRPRDTSTGLPADAVQHVHCRCLTDLSPAAIASKIITGPAQVYGDLVRVVVSCSAVKVVEAEYGEDYPDGSTAPGTYFMTNAAARVAGAGGRGPRSTAASGVQRGGPGTGSGDNHG